MKRLGEGSYGVVVAAEDRELGKKVAIKKVTSFADEQSARQLLRELRLLRHFRGHENVLMIKASLNSLGHISKLDFCKLYLELENAPNVFTTFSRRKS